MIFIGYFYTNDEIKWKTIKWDDNTNTKYSISNIGLIRNNLSGKILKTQFTKQGYERINLSHNGEQRVYLIHRLVANAFIPNPKNKPEVNHKNGNKHCNYVDNLEWVDRSENTLHAYKTGLTKNIYGKRNKLTNKQVETICMLLENGEISQKEIAKRAKCSRNSVRLIKNKISHKDISDLYMIDNYNSAKNFSKRGNQLEATIYSDKQIHEVCKLIDNNISDLRFIANKTNVDYQTVRNVYYGTHRKNISKYYNFIKREDHVIQTNKIKKVENICLLLESGLNTREVSEITGVSRYIIRHIKSGYSWRNISKKYNFLPQTVKKK